MPPSRKLRVGVLFGGRSGEHEVSLLSAASVLNAIDKNKYEDVPIGITKEGRWLTAGDAELLLRGQGQTQSHLRAGEIGRASCRERVQASEGEGMVRRSEDA